MRESMAAHRTSDQGRLLTMILLLLEAALIVFWLVDAFMEWRN